MVIGGGPAGSFAAKLLADKGFSTLIIEKRSEYTEKVCGGFVPYSAIQLLSHNGIDREKMSQICGNRILMTDTNQSGVREQIAYPSGKYGLGVFRHVFDRYLSDQAIQSGAKVVFSQPVSIDQIQYSISEDSYSINLPQNVILTKHLIIATGATGLLPKQISTNQVCLLRKRTFGVSEIIRCTCEFSKETLLFS